MKTTMEHVTIPNSSNIRSVGYDDDARTLHITFHSGKSYTFESVPRDEYDYLLSAESVGSHFHSNIRNKYKLKA